MFKELKENMSKELKENLRTMSHQIGNTNKEMAKKIFLNQTKILELKIAITDMKTSFWGLFMD